MGKKSRERMTGLGTKGRVSRSKNRKQEEEKQRRKMELEIAKAMLPAMLSTPFHPKGKVVKKK